MRMSTVVGVFPFAYAGIGLILSPKMSEEQNSRFLKSILTVFFVCWAIFFITETINSAGL